MTLGASRKPPHWPRVGSPHHNPFPGAGRGGKKEGRDAGLRRGSSEPPAVQRFPSAVEETPTLALPRDGGRGSDERWRGGEARSEPLATSVGRGARGEGSHLSRQHMRTTNVLAEKNLWVFRGKR